MEFIDYLVLINLIFPLGSGTKQAAHRLKILFGLAGFKAAELHGNLTQVQRLDVSNLLYKAVSVCLGPSENYFVNMLTYNKVLNVRSL